jgi:hypothetical protein
VTSPRIKWSITDIAFPMFNNILGARLKPEEADQEIEAAIARGRTRKVPLLWFTGPSTTPADLGRHLMAHGFSHADDSPGMAADLFKLPESPAAIPGLIITPVTGLDSMKIWCDTAVAGYDMPELAGPAFLDWFSSFSLSRQEPLRHYLGFINGRTVATASLLMAAGVAGIYNVAVQRTGHRFGHDPGAFNRGASGELPDRHPPVYRPGVKRLPEIGIQGILLDRFLCLGSWQKPD